MSASLPILASQAFALPHSHRIDNAVSPRQNELYIKRYIDTLYVDVSVVICLLWVYEVAKFVMHNDRRSKTSFSYIRPPALPLRTNKRWCKYTNYFWNDNGNVKEILILAGYGKLGYGKQIGFFFNVSRTKIEPCLWRYFSLPME